jgi:hypothetical protein
MKIIITEEQNEKLNKKIRLTVEKLGLEQSREIFGDGIIKQAYIENPSLFLNQFNNLKPVEKGDKIFYVDNDNLPLFYYYKKEQELKNGFYYISYYRIWVFFRRVMGYKRIEIQKIIKEWLDVVYNLRELVPDCEFPESEIDWEQPIIKTSPT